MDRISPEKRSKLMSKIRSKDTKPEMAIRRLVFSLGYRYRLHDRRLPGKPDLVFQSRRKVIFVHGCFWHQHESCRGGRLPKSNIQYWQPKLEKNVLNDKKNQRELLKNGWKVLVIWECEIKEVGYITEKIINFLEDKA